MDALPKPSLWFEITNPTSLYFTKSLIAALNGNYSTIQIPSNLISCVESLKTELKNCNNGKEEHQGTAPRCRNLAILLSPSYVNNDFMGKFGDLSFPDFQPMNHKILFVDLKGIERQYFENGFTQLGLANCTRQQLTNVLKHAFKQPTYLQVEASVNFPNSSILALSRTANLIPVVTNVFGKFSTVLDPLDIMPIEEEVVKKMADEQHKSPGQILVKHALQRGYSPLIRSDSVTRVLAYSEIDDFCLSRNEMHILNTALVKRR